VIFGEQAANTANGNTGTADERNSLLRYPSPKQMD